MNFKVSVNITKILAFFLSIYYYNEGYINGWLLTLLLLIIVPISIYFKKDV